MFLLPGLKKLCGKLLAKLVDCENVMDILKTARLFNLPRLEDQATEFLARNIEIMMKDVELHKMIEQDAAEVRDREETDSVQIIDDIRSHIRSLSLNCLFNLYKGDLLQGGREEHVRHGRGRGEDGEGGRSARAAGHGNIELENNNLHWLYKSSSSYLDFFNRYIYQ